ncbi:MAG: dephospho-CoA kinase [Ignavibacteria bacterium GWA2_54_16]|nr:MAG: dephospho-CoA kinase [Ignavibacteria bacterium GWA2_54_16]
MAGPHRHILRIGVTGGIGSGKSTACRIFRRHGVPVISADAVAREITDSNPSVRKKIIRLLGPQAYDARGRMNRPFVASRLFGNRRIQRSINSFIHPLVLGEIRRTIRRYGEARRRAVVVEAALIYEAGADKFLDLVIMLEASRQKSIQRIQKRDGLTLEAVRRRIASQWSTNRKKQKADIIIRNDGTTAELGRKIRFLLAIFRLIPGRRTHV